MSKDEFETVAPTMIIPRGTQIEVDAYGQLTVRAPGNLVIQNSGAYGTIESRGGSVRIEEHVEVEAVTVECAETCYIQGSLTAWKVKARSLHVEETAQAQIVLQETERLEIGKDARLVGNFGSENELFLLFSRFAKQVRGLPFYFDRKSEPLTVEAGDGAPPEEPAPALEATVRDPSASLRGEEPGEGEEGMANPSQAGAPGIRDEPEAAQEEGSFTPREASPGRAEELPEGLFFAKVLLERDAGRMGYGPTSERVLEEMVKLLQERDLETLRHTHRVLFSRIVEPREDVLRAQELVTDYFVDNRRPE